MKERKEKKNEYNDNKAKPREKKRKLINKFFLENNSIVVYLKFIIGFLFTTLNL
jgi:hypothetical protein